MKKARARIPNKTTRKTLGYQSRHSGAANSPLIKQKSSLPYVILFLAITSLAGFLLYKIQILQKGNTSVTDQGVPTKPTELTIRRPSVEEHWKGSRNARYVIVEYSDLECPFCKQVHPTIQQLTKENEGKVAWVFRHFPLSFHPKAQKLAEAVECASDQGGNDAFWKMTDAIYEKIPDLQLSQLSEVATSIGLNGSSLKTCLDGNAFEKKVKDEKDEGATAGVQATPSNVIYDLTSGKNILIEAALPYDQFKTQLEAFMK